MNRCVSIRSREPGPFFGPKTYWANHRFAENMDLSPFGRGIALALLLVGLAGCRNELPSHYGGRVGEGASSVNGTAVLAEMFEQAGHQVLSKTSLSPGLADQADCIVWFPDDFKTPRREVREWFENWLADDEHEHVLIYVGRDYDAAVTYWNKVLPSIPADQHDEASSRKRAAETDFAYRRREIDLSPECPWFTVTGEGPPRKVRTLQGDQSWLEGVDSSQVEIELTGRLRPPTDAEVLLASEGDALVSRLSRDDSQIIVVANGSFLLNLPLVNHGHRKLAGSLVREIGEAKQRVVFVESGPGGPRVLDKDSRAEPPTGMEIFHLWPTNWILFHAAVAGIIFCFARLPIFGIPHEPPSEARSDFGKHLDAFGALLARSRDVDHAKERLAQYQQVQNAIIPIHSTPKAHPR